MTTGRPLSLFETAYFTDSGRLGNVTVGGMSIFLGSNVRGPVDQRVLRRVLDELPAYHPMLRCRIKTDGNDALHFQMDDDFRIPLDILDGGDIEYLRLINSPQDWSHGLIRAYLLCDGDTHRIVLVIHHGISDGRSAFALLAQFWRHYTAHMTGALILPPSADQRLPEAVDSQLSSTIADGDVDALLGQLRTVANAPTGHVPPQLPHSGADMADPRGRFSFDRIELDLAETAALVVAARALRVSVNSLITGVVLASIRKELDEPTAPLVASYAADLRQFLTPPIAATTMLNCAFGGGAFLPAGAIAPAAEIAHLFDREVRASLARRDPALWLLAALRVRDAATASMLSSPATLSLSNVGSIPRHSIPDGIEFVRDEVAGMVAGMALRVTAFSIGGRLTVQLDYDTVLHSRHQMDPIHRSLSAALRGVVAHSPIV